FAVDVQTNYPKIIWKTNAQFGYDHNPSMLIERNGIIVFGTKNSLLVGINAKDGSVNWKHKIGNSIINTVSFISNNEFIITTTEGVIARIKF
ncbi:MAG TPA: serine/threonine protein kinase, partial [Paludibacteraceae bacterium]|nr:serine/threonine protein kinase [Paludibacteraceae bacterium]